MLNYPVCPERADPYAEGIDDVVLEPMHGLVDGNFWESLTRWPRRWVAFEYGQATAGVRPGGGLSLGKAAFARARERRRPGTVRWRAWPRREPL
jgi:hypothetical protein